MYVTGQERNVGSLSVIARRANQNGLNATHHHRRGHHRGSAHLRQKSQRKRNSYRLHRQGRDRNRCGYLSRCHMRLLSRLAIRLWPRSWNVQQSEAANQCGRHRSRCRREQRCRRAREHACSTSEGRRASRRSMRKKTRTSSQIFRLKGRRLSGPLPTSCIGASLAADKHDEVDLEDRKSVV